MNRFALVALLAVVLTSGCMPQVFFFVSNSTSAPVYVEYGPAYECDTGEIASATERALLDPGKRLRVCNPALSRTPNDMSEVANSAVMTKFDYFAIFREDGTVLKEKGDIKDEDVSIEQAGSIINVIIRITEP